MRNVVNAFSCDLGYFKLNSLKKQNDENGIGTFKNDRIYHENRHKQSR